VRHSCTGSDPLLVGLERHAELAVEHAQIPIPATHDSIRGDRLNFLSNDADIGFAAAVIAEAVEAEAVIKVAEQRYVVLERDVRPPSTATEPSPAAKPAAADPHAAARAATKAHASTPSRQGRPTRDSVLARPTRDSGLGRPVSRHRPICA